MPKPPSRWWLSFVSLVVVASASRYGTGTGRDRRRDAGKFRAVSAPPVVPGVVLGRGHSGQRRQPRDRGGWHIVARLHMVGAVLARSTSASFATKLRGTAGIEDVGNVAAVHSAIPALSRAPRSTGRTRCTRPAAIPSRRASGTWIRSTRRRPARSRPGRRPCWPASSIRAST